MPIEIDRLIMLMIVGSRIWQLCFKRDVEIGFKKQLVSGDWDRSLEISSVAGPNASLDCFDSFYVARCQHDDGYTDGRSQLRSTPTNERTQVHIALSSLPSTNRGRRSLTSVNVPLRWSVVATVSLVKHERSGGINGVGKWGEVTNKYRLAWGL